MEMQEIKEPIKLTSLTTKGGCGCKIGPGQLSSILQSLPQGERDPNLLVGTETSDDAGVYKLTDDLAIVQTVDFFTPIVNEPYAFGQVAAANALSDVYAMGGTPLTVLNIVAFPIGRLDDAVLAEILRGAGDKVREAGATLVGGHSIDDNEPKFGLAVTGTIHPAKVLTNAGAKPGDRLILTKPIGVGILTTAIKREKLADEDVERVTAVMSTLNRRAAEIMANYNVHACTDITGFGLLGHTLEMAKGSGAGIVIHKRKVPVLPRAKELAAEGIIPGGTKNNFKHVEGSVQFAPTIDELDRYVLCDAVTSGGLLIAVDGNEADALYHELLKAGVEAAMIGEVTADHPGTIVVQDGEEG